MKYALWVLIFSAKCAISSPMIYTFAGAVDESDSNIIDDRASSGLLYSNNIHYNTVIEYKILIDFDRLGETIHFSNGTTTVNPDPAPNYQAFYAQYISGDPFIDLFHGTYYIPGDSAASYTASFSKTGTNVGVNDIREQNSRLYANINEWSNLTIRSTTPYAQDWEVGDIFTSLQSVQNPEYMEHPGELGVKVYLKDISPTPIPEVSELFAFAVGLSLMGIGYRKSKTE
jgi:hypothetical protein